MRLSAKCEYACLALIDLSEQGNDTLIKIEDIARRKKIPKKFLEQILRSLKTAGYLYSKRGIDGGYRLSKKPDKITLAEIIRLIDGPLAPVGSASKYFYEQTPIEQNRQLLNIFCEIRDYIAHRMENTTFADLVKK